MRTRHLRLLGAAAALVFALAAGGNVLGVEPTPTGQPAPSLPCADVPAGGPAGVDLHRACVTNEVVSGLTRSDAAGVDLGFLVGIFVAAFFAAVALVWTADFFVRRYERVVAATTPAAWWACPACHSFNGEEATACYHCRGPRPPDAPLVPGARPGS